MRKKYIFIIKNGRKTKKRFSVYGILNRLCK